VTLKRLERAPLLHHTVQEALKEYVVRSGLKSGDALPSEAELARQLGVSRTSVREAVKALETIGILESRRGSGVFVGEFSFDPLVESLPYGLMGDTRSIAELLDVRCTLEVALVDRAIALRSPEQVEALRGTLARFRALAERREPLGTEDRAFHQQLFMNLENRVLVGLIDVFWRSYTRAAQHIDLVNVDPMATYRDHVAVFDAFVAGDADATRRTLDHHYHGIRELLAARGGGAQDEPTRSTSTASPEPRPS
jgi:DNA-binding FadR family transcriptional regulator